MKMLRKSLKKKKWAMENKAIGLDCRETIETVCPATARRPVS